MQFSDDDQERADWDLLVNGPVTLYWRKSIWLEAVESVRKLGYVIISTSFRDREQFRLDISDALKWQQQFGYSPWTGNFNAFHDGLRDWVFGGRECVAYCIQDIDAWVSTDPIAAHGILDVLASASRTHALFGRRVIALAQTNDHWYDAPPVGAQSVAWTQKEWLTASRG